MYQINRTENLWNTFLNPSLQDGKAVNNGRCWARGGDNEWMPSACSCLLILAPPSQNKYRAWQCRGAFLYLDCNPLIFFLEVVSLYTHAEVSTKRSQPILSHRSNPSHILALYLIFFHIFATNPLTHQSCSRTRKNPRH